MSISNRLYKGIEGAVTYALRWTVKAPDEYADRGYYLLGVVLLLVSATAVSLDWISSVGSRLGLSAQFLQQVPGFPHITPDMTIAGALLMVWFAFFFNRNARRFFGRRVLDGSFRLIGGVIGLGELAILHRATSAIAVTSLVLLLTLGLSVRSARSTERTVRSASYGHWVASVEQFMKSIPSTAPESERLRTLELLWNEAQKGITIDDRSLEDHPGRILRELVVLLNSGPAANQSMGAHLRLQRDSLRSLVAAVANVEQRSRSDTLAVDLVRLAAGRAAVRAAGSQCTFGDLRLAEDDFGSIRSSSLQTEASNGMGTVFSCLMRLTNEEVITWANGESLPCGLPDDCFRAADEAFLEAAEGASHCGFADKRSRNNRTDLFLRAVLQDLSDDALPLPALLEAGSPSERLKVLLDQTIECAGEQPVVPSVFVTLAQGFAVLARLERESSDALRAAALRDSGRFLGLAVFLRGENLEDWSAEPFCTARGVNGILLPPFTRGLSDAGKGGVPPLSPERLQDWLEDGC